MSEAMPPMRILLIGPYSPPRGGVQAHLTVLREHLLAHGVSCEVIDMSPGRKSDGTGVYGPRNALSLARMLLTLRYDISHLHVGGNLTARVTALALLCAALPRRKSVLTFHSGGYPSSPQGRSVRQMSLRALAMRSFDRVVAVNQEIATWFRRIGVGPERVRVINPYALPAAPPMVELPEPMRSFVAEHRPVLVSVGGLEPEYDLQLQIEVLGPLRQKFPHAGLLLVGAGSLEAHLRRLATEKSYGEHVLLCGDVERMTALRVIADSDVMLRTTFYDGDSIAVREALHFGVPVIATDRAPRPAGVHLIPARDLDRLRDAVEICLQDAPHRPAQDNLSEHNLKALFALYEELVRETGSGFETKRMMNAEL